MSYEGHVQRLCSNGHYSEADAYADDVPCHCGASSVWGNAVDDTNGDSFGVIPPKELAKVLVTAEVTAVCNLGHTHVTSHAVYRIPGKDELVRYYRDYKTGELTPV